jgi:hypothetical protein
MVPGNVMVELQTVQTVLMKLTVLLPNVLTVNSTVMAMELNVYLAHGSVMVTTQTVQTVLMNLTVLLHHVQTKVYGIVAMANVSQHHMFVMDQLIPVMQVGVQTVQTVLMKV